RCRLWTSAYRAAGVEPGDRVATMLVNGIDAFCAWLGLTWLNAIEVPIGNAYKGSVLRHCLNDSRSSLLVIDARFAPRIGEIADELKDLKNIVIVGDSGDRPLELGIPARTVTEFLSGHEPATDVTPPRPRDIAAILYTSGTTGLSKGVLMPWAQLYYIATGAIPQRIMSSDDVGYYVGPANHQGGKIWPYLIALAGGTLVVRNTFSTDEYWSDVRKY